jgi:hypothetical protein
MRSSGPLLIAFSLLFYVTDDDGMSACVAVYSVAGRVTFDLRNLFAFRTVESGDQPARHFVVFFFIVLLVHFISIFFELMIAADITAISAGGPKSHARNDLWLMA